MIVAFGDIYAKAADRDQVADLMRATQSRVREQTGCEYYAFAEVLDDPGHFVVVEQWSDGPALERHYSSDAFTEYQAAVAPHLSRTSELRVFEVRESLRPMADGGLGPPQDD